VGEEFDCKKEFFPGALGLHKRLLSGMYGGKSALRKGVIRVYAIVDSSLI
jgi:hypothetical protein